MADPKISAEEVKRHASNESAWIAINGVVWDVTGFAANHPGGREVIEECHGGDASDSYNQNHGPGLLANYLGVEKRKGRIDENHTQVATKVEKAALTGAKALERPSLKSIVNVSQFEAVAEANLPSKTWAYIYGATEDGITNKANASFYRRIMFRPRILRPVASVDTSTTILGQKYRLPFFVAPTSSVKQSHPDGELAHARASIAYGVAPIIPTMSSFSFPEIMEVIPEGHPFFFQLYIYTKRSETERILRMVGQAKPQAILFTVDLPVISKRESPTRLSDAAASVGQPQLAPPPITDVTDANLDWKDIAWIKELSGAPVFLKGIQCAADARRAYEYGCAGIYLTNHGGRALDTAVPAILVLMEIQASCPWVLEKMEVFIDGGVRRGSDILKAICLGASGVLLGRPFLYSLQYGEDGAKHAFNILREELEIAMQLVGITCLDQACPGLLNTTNIDRHVNRGDDHPWAKKIQRRLNSKL